MTITLDSDLAKDLIETKLDTLTAKINSILLKWNLNSPEELITKAKSGELPEAEDDAIDLQTLQDKRLKIEKLLSNLS